MVYAEFAKCDSVTYVLLTTDQGGRLFRRIPEAIQMSHLIPARGQCTAIAPVTNLFAVILALALAVLPSGDLAPNIPSLPGRVMRSVTNKPEPLIPTPSGRTALSTRYGYAMPATSWNSCSRCPSCAAR